MFDVFEETPEEKEQSIVNMLKGGYTYKSIMNECNVSPSTIYEIKKKYLGTPQTNSTQNKKSSKETQAFGLFQQGKSILDAKIELDIQSEEAAKYFRNYQELRGLSDFNRAYTSVNGNINPILRLFYLMNNLAMSPEQVEEQVRYGNNLPYLSNKHSTIKNEFNTMKSQKEQIETQLSIMQRQIADFRRSLKYYEDERMMKKNEISYLSSEIDAKNKFIQNTDNDKGYQRIKEAAKNGTKLVMQDFRMSWSVILGAIVEAIRRYPDNQSLFFDIITNQNHSTKLHQQSWESHAPQLLELTKNVQNEAADQICKLVISTMKSIPSGSQVLG
jgi:hypothetical protein